MKLGAKELRVTKPTIEEMDQVERKNLWLMLDNVLDTYNIGSIFRLADALTVQELILTGGSETPPSSRIHKAAIGTEEWVPWKYYTTPIEAITELKNNHPDLQIVSIEQDEKAIGLVELKKYIDIQKPTLLVVGHETRGVSREVLDASNVIVEIPMWGVNKSLNVHVSAAIVSYMLLI